MRFRGILQRELELDAELELAVADPAGELAGALQAQGDALARALLMARALTTKPRLGTAIAKPTLETLATIELVGTGYCADYAKVFNALGYSAGIPIRQWAFSFDGFGGWGHTFNEIWDEANQRWLMIDVFNGFNNNAVTNAVQTVGSSLGRPSAIVMGRLVRIGGRVTF